MGSKCFTEEIELCRVSGLPDLDQGNTFVRNNLLSWVRPQLFYEVVSLRLLFL